MTMMNSIYRRTAGVIFFLFLCGFGKTGSAQESELWIQGMILENGVWKAPTPETAMRKLLDSEYPDIGTQAAVVAVLNETYNTYPSAVLDAFAMEVGRIFIEGTNWQRFHAQSALRIADRADVIIHIYESRDSYTDPPSIGVLFNMLSGDGGLGDAYLRQILLMNEKPPICNENPRIDKYPVLKFCDGQESLWCKAAEELIGDPAGSPIQEDWDKRCYVSDDPFGWSFMKDH